MQNSLWVKLQKQQHTSGLVTQEGAAGGRGGCSCVGWGGAEGGGWRTEEWEEKESKSQNCEGGV